MATLEKIRSKSVLLIVVIGVALLAFIIGDAITNSRNIFGDRTTVAKIGSEKIDYTDYQRKREELNNQLEEYRRTNPEQAANFDTQLLSQMALDQLIGEKLLDNAVSKMKIDASGDQLRLYMIDQPINQKIGDLIKMMNQNGINVQTPAQAFDVIQNPKANGLTEKQVEGYKRYWLALENETKQMIKRQTYQRLLTGAIQPNELDKKALYNNYVNTKNVAIAYKPYGQIDEKKYTVNDAEIKAQYDKEKAKFAVDQPTKSVSFIAVSVAPSKEDIAASHALANKVMTAMKDSTGQLSKALKNTGARVEHKQLRRADLPKGSIETFVTSASNGEASLVSNNSQGFTAIKKGATTFETDSIQVTIVNVLGDKLPAKVLAQLNSGISTDSIAAKFPADSVMVQAEQWLTLFGPNGKTQAINDNQLDSLTRNAGKFVNIYEVAGQGAVLAKIVKSNAPVAVYEFDQVVYNLHPSEATITSEREKLEKFLAQNATADKFKANAEKAGYNPIDLEVTQSSPAMPRFPGNMQYLYPESRQVVRWVMIDGEPGKVSRVYESRDIQQPMLYAVAVNEAYDDYQPISVQKEYLTQQVRKSKVGDELVKQYNGKTAAQAAEAMGSTVNNDSTFRFGRSMSVRDASVVGRIAGTKKGTKAQAVKGDNGVYVFEVVGEQTEQFPYNGAQYDQQYRQMINTDFEQMLRGSKKLKNNIYKFEAGE